MAIFSFQAVWNDFLAPLIYLHDQSKYTVTLGLNFFRSSYDIRWALPDGCLAGHDAAGDFSSSWRNGCSSRVSNSLV